jgi:hypothetical protein
MMVAHNKLPSQDNTQSMDTSKAPNGVWNLGVSYPTAPDPERLLTASAFGKVTLLCDNVTVKSGIHRRKAEIMRTSTIISTHRAAEFFWEAKIRSAGQ